MRQLTAIACSLLQLGATVSADPTVAVPVAVQPSSTTAPLTITAAPPSCDSGEILSKLNVEDDQYECQPYESLILNTTDVTYEQYSSVKNVMVDIIISDNDVYFVGPENEKNLTTSNNAYDSNQTTLAVSPTVTDSQLVVEVQGGSYITEVKIFPELGLSTYEKYSGMTVEINEKLCDPPQDFSQPQDGSFTWHCYEFANYGVHVYNNADEIRISEIEVLGNSCLIRGLFINKDDKELDAVVTDNIKAVCNCHPGYHLDAFNDDYLCNQNMCYCLAGEGVTQGDDVTVLSLCETDGDHVCSSCTANSRMNERNHCECELGFHKAAVENELGIQDCLGWPTEDEFFECQQNVCICPGGIAATGADCIEDGAEICQSCVVTNSTAEYEVQSFTIVHYDYSEPEVHERNIMTCGCIKGYHKEGDICVENVCACSDGIAVTGDNCQALPNDESLCCDEHELLKCASCFDGYTKNDSTYACDQNNCKCENGIAANDCDPLAPQTVEKCLPDKCDGGFHFNEDDELCNYRTCTCEHGGALNDCLEEGEIGCDIKTPDDLDPANHTLCDTGYHHEILTALNVDPVRYNCLLNQCICENGFSKDGLGCGEHGAISCEKCYPGYNLKPRLDPATNETIIDDATGVEMLECPDVTCPCEYGTGFQNGQCLMDTDQGIENNQLNDEELENLFEELYGYSYDSSIETDAAIMSDLVKTYTIVRGEDDCQSCDIGYQLQDEPHRRIQIEDPRRWYEDQFNWTDAARTIPNYPEMTFPVRPDRNDPSKKKRWDRHKCVPKQCGCDFGRSQQVAVQTWNGISISANTQCRLQDKEVEQPDGSIELRQYHGCIREGCNDYYHMNYDDDLCAMYNCKSSHARNDIIGICQENVCSCYNVDDPTENMGDARSMANPWISKRALDESWFISTNGSYVTEMIENLGDGVQNAWIQDFYDPTLPKDDRFVTAKYLTITNQTELSKLEYNGTDEDLYVELAKEYAKLLATTDLRTRPNKSKIPPFFKVRTVFGPFFTLFDQ